MLRPFKHNNTNVIMIYNGKYCDHSNHIIQIKFIYFYYTDYS